MAENGGETAPVIVPADAAQGTIIAANTSVDSTKENAAPGATAELEANGHNTPQQAHEIPGLIRGNSQGRGRGTKGGRGTKRTSFALDNQSGATSMSSETPSLNGRGRGRGGGRPRGKSRKGSKGTKRKRGADDDDEEADETDGSDSSEVCTPTAIITKSGRSIQKPNAFVPPPPPQASPVTSVKKKQRVWRRNPENAVCKICLRGVSPSTNMIVFCDGCNTPYHRYCHHPPIDQSVVDDVNKEWYCRQCERERILPVPEAEIADFVPAGSVSAEERQKYFASLKPGLLVTLLTKATSLQPDLPLFSPGFHPRTSETGETIRVASGKAVSNPQQAIASPAKPQAAKTTNSTSATSDYVTIINDGEDEDEGYGPEEHPAHYPRPGQGLMQTLPREQDDLKWLVDEENSRGVFHHIYQVDDQATNAGVNGVATEMKD